MRETRDTVWQRRGVSWLWDSDALAQVCEASDAWSMRQFLQAKANWPNELPSNSGEAVVVAGLEGCLDLLAPAEAEAWLEDKVKEAILSFQRFYHCETALVFWMPSSKGRITINAATDAVTWTCSPPNSQQTLDFGRILWGEALEYPQLILLSQGTVPSGLFHRRIS